MAADKQTLPEARDDIKDALIARGPAMFMDPTEEWVVRVKAHTHSEVQDAAMPGTRADDRFLEKLWQKSSLLYLSCRGFCF